MFFCVKDTRFISLGMGVVGLRAASLCTNWQEPTLVGSSNHNLFAAILSHAWQAWSISRDQRFRIQKDWTRKGALWRAEYGAVKRDVRLTQGCRENQWSRAFSSPVTKGHLPPPSKAKASTLLLISRTPAKEITDELVCRISVTAPFSLNNLSSLLSSFLRSE